MSASQRGHITLPHTADVIVEAWGPNLGACAEEAANGLLGLCVAQAEATAESGPVLQIAPGTARAMLAAVLDELIYVFDTSELLPVAVSMKSTADGGLVMQCRVAQPDAVRLIGAAPKAIVMMSVDSGETESRCRFIVDV